MVDQKPSRDEMAAKIAEFVNEWTPPDDGDSAITGAQVRRALEVPNAREQLIAALRAEGWPPGAGGEAEEEL